MTRLRKYAFRLWLLLGVVGLVSLCTGLGNTGQYQFLSKLEHDGVLVEAKVVALRQEGGNNKEPAEYIVSYRFRVGTEAEGEDVTYEYGLAYHEYLKTHVGDLVTVRYSRSDPRVWDFPDGSTAADASRQARRGFVVSIVAGVSFVLVGVSLLYLRIRSPQA